CMKNLDQMADLFPGLVPADYERKNKKKKKKKKLTPEQELEQEILEKARKAKEFDDKYGEDFDIVKLMDEAVDPLTGTLRDLKIDDRDLPLAKNYYDWTFNFVGGASAPWARQM